MKDKTKKILAGACLGLVGMGCLTGCNAEELNIPTDYNITTPTEYDVNIPTEYDVNIPTDFNITATITQEKQYRLTVINDSDHGTIYPDLQGETCSVMVEEGDSYTFSIKAKEGYKLDNLVIDGKLVEPQEIYTFSDVDCDHSIGAIYSKLEEAKEIKSLSIVGISFKSEETFENNIVDIEFFQDKSPENYSAFCKDFRVKLDGESGVGHSILGSKKGQDTFWTYSVTLDSDELIYFDNQQITLLMGKSALEIIKIYLSDLIFVGNSFYNLYKFESDVSRLMLTDNRNEDIQISNLEVFFIVNY